MESFATQNNNSPPVEGWHFAQQNDGVVACGRRGQTCRRRGSTIDAAFASGMPDFEDAVQVAAAKDYKIDTIVSRDAAGFQNSGLRVYSPEEFLGTMR